MSEVAALTGQAQQAVSGLVQNLQRSVSQAVDQAARDIGSGFADLVIDQVDTMVQSFRQSNPAIAETVSTVVGFKDSVETTVGAVTGMVEQVQQAATTLGELPGTIASVRETLTGTVTEIRKLGTSLQTMGTQLAPALQGLRQLPAVQKAVALSAQVWAKAQQILNAALRMNPIGLVVTAVGLLVAGLVTAYQKSETFREIVNAAFQAVWQVVQPVFEGLRNLVMAVWPHIQQVITTAVNAVRGGVTTAMNAVWSVVSPIFTAVRALVEAVWPHIQSVISGVVTAVHTVVSTYFTLVTSIVRTAVSTVVAIVKGIGRIVGTVRAAFGRAVDAVSSGISSAVGFVRELPGRAVSALGNLGRLLLNKGKDLISGFVRGIRNAAGSIVTTIKNFITDKIPGFVKDALGISSPSRVMAQLGEAIGSGLATGIHDSQRNVERAMDDLVPDPRQAAARIAAAPAAAGGGTLQPGAGRRADNPAAGVTVNVHPREGQSEYEIGRMVERELAWAGKR